MKQNVVRKIFFGLFPFFFPSFWKKLQTSIYMSECHIRVDFTRRTNRKIKKRKPGWGQAARMQWGRGLDGVQKLGTCVGQTDGSNIWVKQILIDAASGEPTSRNWMRGSMRRVKMGHHAHKTRCARVYMTAPWTKRRRRCTNEETTCNDNT